MRFRRRIRQEVRGHHERLPEIVERRRRDEAARAAVRTVRPFARRASETLRHVVEPVAYAQSCRAEDDRVFHVVEAFPHLLRHAQRRGHDAPLDLAALTLRAFDPVDVLRISAREDELRPCEIRTHAVRHLPRLIRKFAEEIEFTLFRSPGKAFRDAFERIHEFGKLRLELQQRVGERTLVPLDRIVVLEQSVQRILARTVLVFAGTHPAVPDHLRSRGRIEHVRGRIHKGVGLELRKDASRARPLRQLPHLGGARRVRKCAAV